MAKGSNTMQPEEYSDHSATNGDTNSSPCHEICDGTDRHGNSDDKQSTCSSMENNLAERKLECESTADNKPSDLSISTILSSSGQTVSQSSPIQDDGRLKSFTGVFSRPPDESDSSDAESSKMSSSGPKSLNRSDGSSSSTLPKNEKGQGATIPAKDTRKTSCEKSWEQLVKDKKNALILHRIDKINNIQKSLRQKQSHISKTRLVKKITILRKEIQHLSGGSSRIQRESPLNSEPVKMSSSPSPNKEMMEGMKEVADRTTEVHKTCSEKTEIHVVGANNSAMGDSFSSERSDDRFSEPDFRMNVFEKLGLLHGQNYSCTELASSSADEQAKNSQTSQVRSVENVLAIALKDKGERLTTPYNFVCSEDGQEPTENGQIWVKSVNTNAKYKQLTKAANLVEEPGCGLPNSWSSAFISENQPEVKEIGYRLKRKQTEIDTLNEEPAIKRRCKTLPRKVVRTNHLGQLVMPFKPDACCDETSSGQECEETVQEWEKASTEPEVGAEDGNGDSKIVTTVDSGDIGNDDKDDVNRSHLSIKSGTEFITPRIYDDDTLQRSHELRESKISELIRKQEGLLQTLEKMSSKSRPNN